MARRRRARFTFDDGIVRPADEKSAAILAQAMADVAEWAGYPSVEAFLAASSVAREAAVRTAPQL